jgi:DNA invertase Pin-like site-specific DNA recombinase
MLSLIVPPGRGGPPGAPIMSTAHLPKTRKAAEAAAPLRAVIYTRISHDAEGSELGVIRQLDDCTAYAERHGWTIVHEYRDNDAGASTRSRKPRPAYAAMMAAVAAGEADVIIAYSASRITRRVADWQSIIDMIESGRKAGRTIRVETIVSGKIDVNSADGRMMLGIMAQIDQGEAERTAERVTRKHRERQDAGRHNWTRRPFGFNADGTPCEAEAAAIEAAARMVIEERATLYSIAKAWNGADVLTATGARWTIQSVGDLLRSPRLAALLNDGRPGTWSAILTPDRWRAMCAVLDERGRAVAVRNGVGRLAMNLMSGIAECYADGCTGRIAVSRAGGRRKYQCSAGHVQAPADTVDAHVARWIASGRRTGKLGKAGTYAALRGAETVETAPMIAERDRLSAQIAETTDAIRAGQAVAILAPILADLDRQRTAIVAKLAAAEAAAERARSLPALVAEWESLTVDGRREILRDLAESGWIFQLRPYCEGEPDERIVIIDSTYVPDAGALGMLD